jgi:selenocysteine lyase/cysteine desulfurase
MTWARFEGLPLCCDLACAIPGHQRLRPSGRSHGNVGGIGLRSLHSELDAVSGVLAAMGLDAARAVGAVRLSVGRMTRADDIDRAAAALVAAWTRLARP